MIEVHQQERQVVAKVDRRHGLVELDRVERHRSCRARGTGSPGAGRRARDGRNRSRPASQPGREPVDRGVLAAEPRLHARLGQAGIVCGTALPRATRCIAAAGSIAGDRWQALVIRRDLVRRVRPAASGVRCRAAITSRKSSGGIGAIRSTQSTTPILPAVHPRAPARHLARGRPGRRLIQPRRGRAIDLELAEQKAMPGRQVGKIQER